MRVGRTRIELIAGLALLAIACSKGKDQNTVMKYGNSVFIP